jgi:hypothetical protein
MPSQDILLIVGSVLLFGEQVTPMQVFGKFNYVLRFRLSSLESFGFFLIFRLFFVASLLEILHTLALLSTEAVVMSAALFWPPMA